MLLTLLICICIFIWCLLASSQTCDPKGNENPWVTAREMPTGCWTNFVTEDKAEVHIFNLHFDHKVRTSRLYKEDCIIVFLMMNYVTQFGAIYFHFYLYSNEKMKQIQLWRQISVEFMTHLFRNRWGHNLKTTQEWHILEVPTTHLLLCILVYLKVKQTTYNY